ncbi:MAG: hypothetical protein FWC16_10860 [Defluviitaleaceae bacterium]|nr:hypothetical protein [Defluviitaleaceae bacterium]MCL2275418.1 hypothetical protein [Defluviitaleaceae bacterium]
MQTVYHKMIITARPESAVFAMAELQKYDASIRPLKDLDAGVKLVTVPQGHGSFFTDAPRLMFVRHIFPVLIEGSVQEITPVKLAESLPLQDMVGAFSVQKRGEVAFAFIQSLEALLCEKGFTQNDKSPAWVVSLFSHENILYAGVSDVKQNRSAWNGGARRYKKENVISRAEFKLMEAFEIFNLSPAENTRALDLGAAPGGWSKVLLDRGFYVTAVDPGALDARLAHPQLTYVNATAQRFFAAYKGAPFHFIVNDMKMDMYESIRIMLDAAHLLTPGGTAIMTLKLAKGQGLSKINKALALLEKKYRVADTRQLFHNRDEVTVVVGSLPPTL